MIKSNSTPATVAAALAESAARLREAQEANAATLTKALAWMDANGVDNLPVDMGDCVRVFKPDTPKSYKTPKRGEAFEVLFYSFKVQELAELFGDLPNDLHLIDKVSRMVEETADRFVTSIAIGAAREQLEPEIFAKYFRKELGERRLVGVKK